MKRELIIIQQKINILMKQFYNIWDGGIKIIRKWTEDDKSSFVFTIQFFIVVVE